MTEWQSQAFHKTKSPGLEHCLIVGDFLVQPFIFFPIFFFFLSHPVTSLHSRISPLSLLHLVWSSHPSLTSNLSDYPSSACSIPISPTAMLQTSDASFFLKISLKKNQDHDRHSVVQPQKVWWLALLTQYDIELPVKTGPVRGLWESLWGIVFG